MTVSAPTLETDRLIMRTHSRADWPAHKSILMSDRAQYMDGKLDEEGAWACFASEIASWALDGFGYWAATRKDTGEAVAFTGFIKPSHFPEVELGWMTTVAGEGNGYAFEAAQAARDWGFADLGLETIVSYIHPENSRSIALAKRLGAIQDDDAPKPDDNPLVFRHPNLEAA